MQINEIVQTEQRPEFIEEYANLFDGCPQMSAFNSIHGQLTYSEVPETMNHDAAFGLFNDQKLVAIILLSDERHGKMQISKSITAPSFMRMGCFRFLLNKAVARYREVLSDDRQTPMARSAWETLIKSTGSTLIIRAYDPETNSYSSNAPHQVWDNDDILLSATRRNTKIDESNNPNNVFHRNHRTGRDYNSIYYGFPSEDRDNP